MRNSAIDIWNDLRAKRLWPVALLLLAAIVALPALVLQGAEEPPRAPASAAGSAANASEPPEVEGLASVKLEESLPSEGSSLDTFDPSDPFRPPEKVLKQAEQPAAGSTAAGPTAETTSAAGSSSSSGAASATAGGGTGSSGDAGSPGDVGSPGGSGNAKENGGATTTTTEHTWVLDVTFTTNGRMRKLKGLERLDILPGRASPLLVFLGVSSNAGNAVFLVDSTLERAGKEGKCKPSEEKCALVYLGAGSAQVFTNEAGDAYGLKIDRIRKVKLNETSAARTPANSGPKIRAVAAMRSRVGGTLTISGRNFENKRLANTVIFRAPDGRSTLVKPRRASRTRLVVTVPAVLRRLLSGDAGAPEPTRFKLRVLTGRLGGYTPRRLSPVITD